MSCSLNYEKPQSFNWVNFKIKKYICHICIELSQKVHTYLHEGKKMKQNLFCSPEGDTIGFQILLSITKQQTDAWEWHKILKTCNIFFSKRISFNGDS